MKQRHCSPTTSVLIIFIFYFLLGTELPLKVPGGGGCGGGCGKPSQTQRRHLSSFKPVSILGNGELSPLKSPGRVATEDRRRLEEGRRRTKCAGRRQIKVGETVFILFSFFLHSFGHFWREKEAPRYIGFHLKCVGAEQVFHLGAPLVLSLC